MYRHNVHMQWPNSAVLIHNYRYSIIIILFVCWYMLFFFHTWLFVDFYLEQSSVLIKNLLQILLFLGKSTFRLVYHTGTDFRHHDFECDMNEAVEIIEKVNNIMEMKSNLIRKEYLAHKENKHRLQNPFKRHSSVN